MPGAIIVPSSSAFKTSSLSSPTKPIFSPVESVTSCPWASSPFPTDPLATTPLTSPTKTTMSPAQQCPFASSSPSPIRPSISTTLNNSQSSSPRPLTPLLSPVKSVHHCLYSPSPDSPIGNADPHRFIPPTPGSSRAPCPALNALANHGYLPRSGKQITFQDIIYAMKEGFGLSPAFALFMAAGSFALMKRWFGHPFDLHETAIHGLIEHNASLVHDDADLSKEVYCRDENGLVSYAPINVDPVLLRRFMKIASPLHPGGELVYTTENVAEYRVEREKETKIPDFLHQEIARAEFSMIIQIFGKEEDNGSGNWCVDEKIVVDFFTKQRFPEGWRPQRVLHLMDAAHCTDDIRNNMESIRKIQHKKTEGQSDQECTHLL
ncbi:hypothetical protein Clacol_002189 [Clathrus columnatus]|uniref:Heme haloperoxidase family profile domain-containing protein n=1 Tax=Clathrus columnatus TaxID=1419009 RepID=A0AAV5A013_9AGAM|nr:hypothetical protein Clacol_002189 [Clathrus columnatus]